MVMEDKLVPTGKGITLKVKLCSDLDFLPGPYFVPGNVGYVYSELLFTFVSDLGNGEIQIENTGEETNVYKCQAIYYFGDVPE
jgi:hypothetical protein